MLVAVSVGASLKPSNHPIHEDLSHNDHQIVAKMLVSLAAREKPSNLRSLKD